MSQDSNQSNRHDAGSESQKKPSSGTAKEATSPFLTPLKERTGIDEAKVARAKKLLDQEGYPSNQVLRSVAQHLARNWPQDDTDAPPRPRQ